MKYYIIPLLFIFNFSNVFCQIKLAPEKTTEVKKPQEIKPEEVKRWKTDGKFTFLFNQSAFSNWAAGGDNTLAGNINVNYNFNYKKNNFIWNNKIVASYGLTKNSSTDFPKKTADGVMFNSLFGFDAENYWFYSILVNFKTQFSKGYKYSKDANGIEIRTLHTDFMSPGYLLIGPGMLWEKSKKLKLNLAPATTKFVFVNKEFTLPNKKYFGVEEGESLRLELGFSASFLYKFKIMENISMENVLAFFSNYLDNPQNIDVNYLMSIDMKINKYFSTNFIFQTIYDDNAFNGFQVREIFGLGINYDFKFNKNRYNI